MKFALGLGPDRWSTKTRITDMRGDLQPESCLVALQVTACSGRGHIVAVFRAACCNCRCA